MAVQHHPRDLVRPSSGYKELAQTMKKFKNCSTPNKSGIYVSDIVFSDLATDSAVSITRAQHATYFKYFL